MDLITQRMKLKDVFPNFSDIAQKYGVDKDAEFIRKGYTPSEIKFIDGEKAVVSYINTAAIDRDAEVTLPEGGVMDAYKENPVVMFGHDYKALPIGKCDSLKLDSKGWQAKTVYANTDKATEIYEYRRAGFPLAESIGFIPIESISQGEDGFDDLAKDLVKRGAFKRGDISKIRRIHSKWAMLEYSDVPIPSNPEALQVAIAKGLILPETLIDDIVNAPIVDLTKELPEVITKPEETGEMYRLPVPGEEGKHEGHRIRTIDVSEDKGITALYCGQDKKIITYMFDKEKWDSMEAARAWMMDHMGKGFEHEISQSEIIDEIDYLKSLIDKEGLCDKAKTSLQGLIKILGGKIKMDMAGMKKMMTMMADCEKMAGEAKDMASSAMEDMKSVKPGNDIPVDDKKDIKPEDAKPVEKQEAPIQPTPDEIQDALGQVKF